MSIEETIQPIDPIIIAIGPLDITWYAFLIVLAMSIGILYTKKEMKNSGLSDKEFYDLAFYVLLFGIIGCRLYEVILQWEYYSQNLMQIPAIWNGGLSIQGGIIAGMITLFILSKKMNFDLLKTADIFVIPLLFGQAIGRWGNFFNQEVYGRAISGTLEEQRAFLEETLHLPDFIVNQMYIEGAYHLPIFLFESIWNIIGVMIMLLMRYIGNFRAGIIAGVYLIWYSVGRIWIETLKEENLTIIGSINGPTTVSIGLILIGISMIIYAIVKKTDKRS